MPWCAVTQNKNADRRWSVSDHHDPKPESCQYMQDFVKSGVSMIERTLPEVVLCKSTYFVQLNDKNIGVRNFTIPGWTATPQL